MANTHIYVPKLVIIFAGGTIASGKGPNGYEPRREVIENLLSRMNYQGDVEIVMMDPLIDSSHATPADWMRMTNTIMQYASPAYRIILAHGTDTMVFTSAALEYALPADFPTSVVLTGSQHAPDIRGSDALPNLRRSIRVAETLKEGVVISFGRKVIGGTRPFKFSADRIGAFEAPKQGGIIAEFHKVSNGEALLYKDKFKPRLFRPSGVPIADGFAQDSTPLRSKVAKLRVWPGMTLREATAAIAAEPNTDGVIIEAYGTGNVANRGAIYEALSQNNGLIPGLPDLVSDWLHENRINTFSDLMGNLDERGKVVVITTQSPHGGVHLGHYKAGQVSGAISGFNMSPDTAAVKLTYAFARSRDPHTIKEMIQTPMSGDFDPRYKRAALKAA